MTRTPAAPALTLLVLASSLACGQEGPPTPNVLSAVEAKEGFHLLFDGQSTAGWRSFRAADAPAGWQAVDGTLTRTGEGGDIITTDEFQSFELRLEWNISAGGNSGIMYRVTEEAEATYETGPEMQVLDDARHADGKSRLTAAGSCFGLYPAPAGIVRPPGEWNEVKIIVNGPHVEHWLNGTKVVEYELGSAEWEAKVKASKFAQWPGFGRAAKGHIALQNHGDQVAYRSIRIKVLP